MEKWYPITVLPPTWCKNGLKKSEATSLKEKLADIKMVMITYHVQLRHQFKELHRNKIEYIVSEIKMI